MGRRQKTVRVVLGGKPDGKFELRLLGGFLLLVAGFFIFLLLTGAVHCGPHQDSTPESRAKTEQRR